MFYTRFFIKFTCALLCLVHIPQYGYCNDFENSVFNVATEWQLDLIRNGRQNEQNFVTSPTGLGVLLGQMRIFANPQLRELINILLIWGKGNSVHMSFAETLKQLSPKEDEQFVLSNKNAIFKKDSVNISSITAGLLRDHYSTEILNVQLSNAVPPTDPTIDDWVKQNSQNLIQHIDIPPNTSLVLANLMYFKATWFEQFQKTATKKDPFYVTPQGPTVTADFMTISEELLYSEDTYYLKCKVISKPYVTKRNQQEANSSRVMMHIVVPDEGVDNLLNKITALNFGQMLEGGSIMKVTYKIPKVQLQRKYDFKEFLQHYYEREYFTQEKLNFNVRGLNSDAQVTEIGQIQQESVLRIGEEGTEAGSLTSSSTVDLSAAAKTVKIDKPFIVIIREETTKLALFWATIRNPNIE